MPVERHSSAAIDLARPALWPKQDGHYVLLGYLVKQCGAATTANSHVDVRLLGSDGAMFAEHQVEFQPRELKGHLGRRIPRASYEWAFDTLPPGTARISAVAHD